MKIKPMIFNSEMVEALLDGRKTVTRRPAKDMSFSENMGFQVGKWCYGIGATLKDTMNNCISAKASKCPARVGDLIYVRETFRLFDNSDECGCSEFCGCPPTGTPIYFATHNDGDSKWKPSIHMPRWASRLTLKVTDVRIEKLNDLRKSDEQVKKEGFDSWPKFKHVWESIYGQSNPNDYVWVIEFEVIHQNVDKYLEAINGN